MSSKIKRDMLVSANRLAKHVGANESLQEDLLAVMAGLDLALEEHDMSGLKLQIRRRN
jgi:hypothetical protein